VTKPAPWSRTWRNIKKADVPQASCPPIGRTRPVASLNERKNRRDAYVTRPGAGGICPLSMVRRLSFELLLKSLQIVSANIGNSPVVEVGVNPMQKLIALARYRLRGPARIRFCRPNKKVNEMFAPLVNQGRHRPVIEIITSYFSLPTRATKRSLSLARARASRDMTVPGGICTMSAISL
jgi:hypothetical protein